MATNWQLYLRIKLTNVSDFWCKLVGLTIHTFMSQGPGLSASPMRILAYGLGLQAGGGCTICQHESQATSGLGAKWALRAYGTAML